MWENITEKNKKEFNALATHPLQSYEWGEFRKKTGVSVIRKGLYKEKKLQQILQVTIHKIPHTKWTIGYFPKGSIPTREVIDELKKIGKENNCIFIQLEPNVIKSQITNHKPQKNWDLEFGSWDLQKASHPLFTKYTFLLDLTKSPEDLLKQMSQKTRYNIRVAIKHEIQVREEFSEDAFNAYLALTQETTHRQRFFAHTKKYHQLMWETLKTERGKLGEKHEKNNLQAHLFVAYLGKQPLTTWVVFTFHDALYYPYGASSSQHREAMSSNLMMWDVIMFGKKMGLKLFDMWGSLGPNPDTKDSWYGFHRFKQGYGPELVEFVGSYDLVIRPLLYQGYKITDMLRWLLLRLRK
ncbi:MAG TPA: peptidoglycan bridge formation glycyltransferase FemA/FemB family protein [Patescibacteria group bacterium]|nr:peptidoglycan bridge formation glycyltransferase FemA/FemB family protein [Patescibacteria group bacterium]